ILLSFRAPANPAGKGARPIVRDPAPARLARAERCLTTRGGAAAPFPAPARKCRSGDQTALRPGKPGGGEEVPPSRKCCHTYGRRAGRFALLSAAACLYTPVVWADTDTAHGWRQRTRRGMRRGGGGT